MKAKTFEGTVTQFLEHKGIGVVTPSDNSSSGSTRKVRFHISDLDVDSVSEGDELEFGIRKTDDGYEARDPTLSKSTTSSTSSHQSSTNSGRGNTNSSSTKPGKMRGCEGTVATYYEEDGYGFVSTADITRERDENEFETTDVFFHISDLDSNTVSEGDRLEFDVVETDEGPQAVDPAITERNDTSTDAEITRTDPAEKLGVSGSKDDTQYGREDSTTSGDVESFADDRKFR